MIFEELMLVSNCVFLPLLFLLDLSSNHVLVTDQLLPFMLVSLLLFVQDSIFMSVVVSQ